MKTIISLRRYSSVTIRSIFAITFVLFLYSCGGGSGSDSENTITDENNSTILTGYSIYGGVFNGYDCDPENWESRTLIGTADGTASFDLATVGLESIRDIQIVSDGITFVDSIENLQTNATVGMDGEGLSLGINFTTGSVDGWMSAIGPPDDVGARIPKEGYFICELPTEDGPGDDLTISIGSKSHTVPYQGTGEAISESDIDEINAILYDLKIGYENKDRELILSYIKDTIYDRVSSELDQIFNCFESIDINILEYIVNGNMPYAAIEHIENFENIYSLSWRISENSSGSSISDALSIYFEKVDDRWMLYYIERVFNFHAKLLAKKNRYCVDN